ncbi:MAG TPA: FG-GAP-like repeat-containing protein [Myxococcota bacterium]|nr:FG-GAP-like repeat-containing protein [Myxococcota bacterium]
MLLLLACQTPADSTADSPAVVESASPSGSWSTETFPACEAPLSEAHWTASELLPEIGYDPPVNDNLVGIEPGSIALFDAPSGPILLYTDTSGTARGYWLADGSSVDGLSNLRGLASFSIGDIDGDGLLDLVASGPVVNLLWDYDGSWKNVTELRTNDEVFVRDTVLADFDGDGDLDLLLTRSGPLDDPATLQASLVENLGDRKLADPVPVPAPADFWGKTFDATAVDLSGDGAPEVFFCNDLGATFAPNALLSNDGKGGLSPATDALGLDFRSSCMGLALGDLDHDGDLDISLSDAVRHYFLLQVEGGFVDASASAAIPVLANQQMYWGNSITDLDNDGRNELVLPSSWFWTLSARPFPVYALSETDSGAWEDHGEAWGFPQRAGTRTVLVQDLNDDGLQDLIFGDGWRTPHLLLSDGCTSAGWIEVEAPEGTLIQVDLGDQTVAGRVSRDGSYGSAGRARLHLGTGARSSVVSVTAQVPWKGEFMLDGPIPTRSRVTLEID